MGEQLQNLFPVQELKDMHADLTSLVTGFVKDVELDLELNLGKLKAEIVKEERSGQKKPGFFSNFSLRRGTTFSSNVHKYQGGENDFFEIEDMAHGDES